VYHLILLRHAWNIAKLEWDWALGPDPLEKIEFPKPNPARERRLMPGEFVRLQEAASIISCWYLWPIVELAIETAMRKGELLSTARITMIRSRRICIDQPITILAHKSKITQIEGNSFKKDDHLN